MRDSNWRQFMSNPSSNPPSPIQTIRLPNQGNAVDQALALLQAGRPDDALSVLHQAVLSAEVDGRTYAVLADLLLSRFRAQLAAVKGNTTISSPDELVTSDIDQEILDGLDEAIAYYRKALALGHDTAEIHNNYGIALTYHHDDEEAISELGKAILLDPNSPHTEWILCRLLVKAKRYEEAFPHWQRAAAVLPNHPGLLTTAGKIYFAAGRFKECIEANKRAAQLAPDDPEIQQDLGVAYSASGRYDLAIPHLQTVFRNRPNDRIAQDNLATVYAMAQRPDEAIEVYRNALQHDPTNFEAEYRLCQLYLATGQFEPGWQRYSLRWKIGNLLPLWPTDLDDPRLYSGSIYVYADQGIGDQIFFLRFVPQLRARGQRVHYCTDSKIESIIRRLDWLDEVVPMEKLRTLTTRNPVAVSDLPRLLRMHSTAQIPPPVRLSVLPDRVSKMREKLAVCGPPPYIAVTWRAGTRSADLSPNLKGALFKEAPIESIGATLRNLPGTVIVLQRLPDPGECDALALALRRPAHDFSQLNQDLEDMLALLSLVDEYVTVSNTNVHLLAGLGKTARILVPRTNEWRWMLKGSESPWFPGFSLYRQDMRLDWNRAFSDLKRDLRQILGTKS